MHQSRAVLVNLLLWNHLSLCRRWGSGTAAAHAHTRKRVVAPPSHTHSAQLW